MDSTNSKTNDESEESQIPPNEGVKKLDRAEIHSVSENHVAQTDNEPKTICTFNQILTAIAVSLTSLVMGYTTAYTSPADASLRKDFGIGNSEMSWIGGLMPLNAILGGLLGGVAIELCGRRGTLFLTNFILLVSWLVICYSKNYCHLYVGRCLGGLSVGLATLTLPVYLVETIQLEARGILGLLPMTFGNTGILLCFVYGIFLDWNSLAAIGVILNIPFILIFIWIIPETPTWYVANSKLDKCKETLEWLRGKEQNITKEYNELIRKHNESKSAEREFQSIFKSKNAKSLTIILGLMFFQQFSGINAIIFYTTLIFQAAGSSLSPPICTTIIGFVNMVSTLIINLFIDSIGRKLLLQMSSILMSMGLGCLGFYYYVGEILMIQVNEYGYMTLVSLIIFVTGFSIGFGPIPWLLMNELVPSDIRGIATLIATSVNWSCTFLITLTFSYTVELFGYYAVFWFYCCMTLSAGILTWLFVPETIGRSLADIEGRISEQNTRNRRSISSLKPLPSTNM